jgi:4,5-DOPA dioxygenase extradiol
MFGEDFRSVPIVQASIDGPMGAERNWLLGKAITKLRCVPALNTPLILDVHLAIGKKAS